MNGVDPVYREFAEHQADQHVKRASVYSSLTADRQATSTNVRRPLNGIYFQLNVEIRNLSQLLKFGPSISVVSTPTFVFPKSFCSPFKLIIFRTDFEGNAFGICDHNVTGLVPFRDHTCLELVPICDHKW